MRVALKNRHSSRYRLAGTLVGAVPVSQKIKTSVCLQLVGSARSGRRKSCRQSIDATVRRRRRQQRDGAIVTPLTSRQTLSVILLATNQAAPRQLKFIVCSRATLLQSGSHRAINSQIRDRAHFSEISNESSSQLANGIANDWRNFRSTGPFRVWCRTEIELWHLSRRRLQRICWRVPSKQHTTAPANIYCTASQTDLILAYVCRDGKQILANSSCLAPRLRLGQLVRGKHNITREHSAEQTNKHQAGLSNEHETLRRN